MILSEKGETLSQKALFRGFCSIFKFAFCALAFVIASFSCGNGIFGVEISPISPTSPIINFDWTGYPSTTTNPVNVNPITLSPDILQQFFNQQNDNNSGNNTSSGGLIPSPSNLFPIVVSELDGFYWYCPNESAEYEAFPASGSYTVPNIKDKCTDIEQNDNRDMWFCLVSNGTSSVGLTVKEGYVINDTSTWSGYKVHCAPANFVYITNVFDSGNIYLYVNYNVSGTDMFTAVQYFNSFDTYGCNNCGSDSMSRSDLQTVFASTMGLWFLMDNTNYSNWTSSQSIIGPTQDLDELDSFYDKTPTETYVFAGPKFTLKCPVNQSETFVLWTETLRKSQLYDSCAISTDDDNYEIWCKKDSSGGMTKLEVDTLSLCHYKNNCSNPNRPCCDEYECEIRPKCGGGWNCEAGEYLPYGGTECADCPQGYYCPGHQKNDPDWCYADSGTNTFDDIGGQGIYSCAVLMDNNDATTEGTGKTKETDCYIPCKNEQISNYGILQPKQDKIYYTNGFNFTTDKCKYVLEFKYKQKKTDGTCNVDSCCTDPYQSTTIYSVEDVSDDSVLCQPAETDVCTDNGKEFDKWNIDTIVNRNNNNNVVVLYATCKNKTYSITYILNGGACESNACTPTSYTYGMNVTLPAPTKEGYEFGGWYENAAFSGDAVTAITNTSFGDKTFYAKWLAKCGPGTYLPANSDTCAVCPQHSYCEGGEFAQSASNQGIKSCSTETNGKFPRTYSCYEYQTPNDSLTPCIKGAEKIEQCHASVSFRANGDDVTFGSNSFEYKNVSVFYREDASVYAQTCAATQAGAGSDTYWCYRTNNNFYITTTPDIQRNGYSLNGWKKCIYTESGPTNCAAANITTSAASTTSPYGPENNDATLFDLTTDLQNGTLYLYADWKPITYYICYQDGQDAVQTETACDCNENTAGTCGNYKQPDYNWKYTYTIQDTFTLPVPNRPVTDNNNLGWDFDGWYESGSDTKISKITGKTGNLTLNARWKKQMATVNFACSYSKIVTVADKQVGEVVPYPSDSPCNEVEAWSCDGGEITDSGIKTTSKTPITCRSAYKIKYMNPDGDTNKEIKINNQTLTPRTYTWRNTVYWPSVRTMNDLNIRPGYSFVGWFYDTDFTNETTGLAPRASGTKILYAKWVPIDYTIKFDKNGGTGDTMTPLKNVNVESVDGNNDPLKLTANTYQRTGYAFDGWCLEKNCDNAWAADNAQINGLDLSPQQTTITLYAKWNPTSNTITYDTNGGTCSDGACVDATYTIEDTIELPTAENVSKVGYTFAGWYDNEQLSGESVTVVEQGSTGDKTFYAKWTPKTITCESGQYLPANSEDCVECPEGSYCTAGSYIYDGTAQGAQECPDYYPNSAAGSDAITDCYNTTKSCKDVKGCPQHASCQWDQETATCKSYNDGTDSCVFDDENTCKITITCDSGYQLNEETQQCAKKYTVSYKHCGYATGNLGQNPQTYFGAGLTLLNTDTVMEVWTKPGYTFTDWCRAADTITNGKRECRNDIEHVSAGDGLTDNLLTESDLNSESTLTIFACPVWKPIDYTIHYYNAMDDELMFDDNQWPESQPYNIESASIDLLTPDAPTGYTFAGWCMYDEQQITPIDCDAPITTLTVSSDMLGDKYLYAKWTPKTITCESGQYLPANSEDCVECPEGSYCAAGSYIYDGTAQGATECPNNYSNSDAGSDAITDCYRDCPEIEHKQLIGGKISYVSETEADNTCEYEFACESDKWLHIGAGDNDKVCLYETKPSGAPVLGIKVGTKPYYIMLSADEDMTISNNSNKKLRVKIDNTTYNAHDASVME